MADRTGFGGEQVLRCVAARRRQRRYLRPLGLAGALITCLEAALGCSDPAFNSRAFGHAGGEPAASSAGQVHALGGSPAGSSGSSASDGLGASGTPSGGFGAAASGAAGLDAGGTSGAGTGGTADSGGSGDGGLAGLSAAAAGRSGAGGVANSAGSGGASTSSAGAAGKAGASGSAGAAPVDTLPFVENFEDGNLDGWKLQNVSAFQYSVLPGTGARGTARGLLLTKAQATDYCCDAFNRQFPSGLKPKSISVWLRSDATGVDAGYFRLNATTDATSWIAYVNFYQTGLYIRGTQTLSLVYTTGRWYHVEFRKIDWDAQSFEVWVDDAQLGNLAMNTAASSLKRIDLYARNPSATAPAAAYVDEIELKP